MRRIAVNTLISLFSLVVSLAVAELVLRALTPFPVNYLSNREPHPDLGYVLSRNLKDVDRYGFRNADSGKRGRRIAAVGDSHTFGLHVASWEAWPSLLQERLQKPVYNYGVPGYTPFHYRYLVRAAIEDGAKVIIISLLLQLDVGSDLEIPCNFLGAGVVMRLDKSVRTYFSQLCEGAKLDKKQEEKSIWERITQATRKFVKSESAVTSALYTLVYERMRYAVQGSKNERDDRYYRSDGKIRCKILNEILVRSKEDMQKRLGFLQTTLGEIDEMCRAGGVRCGYLILPSVGRAIHAAADGSDDLTALKDAAFKRELLMVRDVERFLEAKGMIYVDAAVYVGRHFRDAMRQGEEFRTLVPWDHHPRADGYAAYAEAALGLLKRMERDGLD